MVTTSLYRPVAGIHRDHIARLNLALAGVSYLAQKWQLIAYTEREPVGRGRPGMRTSRQLWALPVGRYCGLSQVLVGAARTARGHPTASVPSRASADHVLHRARTVSACPHPAARTGREPGRRCRSGWP